MGRQFGAPGTDVGNLELDAGGVRAFLIADVRDTRDHTAISGLDRALSRALHLDQRVVDLAPWALLWNGSVSDFVSERVGNYRYNPQWGALLSQLWVE